MESEFERKLTQHIEKAALSIWKNLRLNGYKLDDGDKALLLNELHYYFFKDTVALQHALNDADFHLDEFSSGYCSIPRRAKPKAVPKAVDEAMGTLRLKIAMLEVECRVLREALTELKVAHLNKKVSLPIRLHALIENTLAETGEKKRKQK